jgi:integrase
MAKMDAGFFKRGKNYQIRRVVPGDLQLFLDRKEILKSLRTGDEAEAIRRYRSEATKIDDYFEQQRQLMEMGTPSPVVGEQSSTARTAEGVRSQIIEHDLHLRERLFIDAEQDPEKFWSGKLIEIPETEYARHLLHNGDLDPFLSYCIRQQQELERAGRARARGDVREFLSAAGGDRLQARNLLLAKQAALKEVIGHSQEPASREIAGEPAVVPVTAASPSSSGPKLSEVAQEWFAKKLRVNEWTTNTRDEHDAALTAFTEVCGDKPIGSYDKADGRKFKSVLLRLPANAHKKAPYKDLTLSEAAEQAKKLEEADLLSPVTINKLIRKVSAFFSHCMSSYDECTSNPMARPTDRARQGQADDRNPFSAEQLQIILSSPLYVGCKSEARWSEPGPVTLDHTAKFWVFLIGVFSGARLGEIIQLHVDDIKVEDEVPYFDFSETAPGHPYPKSLKTSASWRRTPIHSQMR